MATARQTLQPTPAAMVYGKSVWLATQILFAATGRVRALPEIMSFQVISMVMDKPIYLLPTARLIYGRSVNPLEAISLAVIGMIRQIMRRAISSPAISTATARLILPCGPGQAMATCG